MGNMLLFLKVACDERANLLNNRPEYDKVEDLFEFMKVSQKNRAIQFWKKLTSEIPNSTLKSRKCLRSSQLKGRIRGESNQYYRWGFDYVKLGFHALKIYFSSSSVLLRNMFSQSILLIEITWTHKKQSKILLCTLIQPLGFVRFL